MKKSRVYICHTYYHAYQATVKELVRRREILRCAQNDTDAVANRTDAVANRTDAVANRTDAVILSGAKDLPDIILSTMSNDFETLDQRLQVSGVFGNVYLFDEREDVTDETVMSYHRDKGNLIANLLQRITYTRLLGKLQEPCIPVDLSQYGDIYVFCDSDPIGYYLNYKKLPYHAIEDGLNSGKLDDQARNANRGAFWLKKLLAETGLIFIESGYSRYCIDYEVNDISVNKNPPKNIIQCPVEDLYAQLTKEDHETLVRIFMPDAEEIRGLLSAGDYSRPKVMILTEPLCALDVRERLFRDIVEMYASDHTVIIKPHPRDLLDYEEAFPEQIVIRGRFPMEVIGDMPELQVDKLVSVVTQVDHVRFAKEIVYLGMDFMDRYEAPELHRKNELL